MDKSLSQCCSVYAFHDIQVTSYGKHIKVACYSKCMICCVGEIAFSSYELSEILQWSWWVKIGMITGSSLQMSIILVFPILDSNSYLQ